MTSSPVKVFIENSKKKARKNEKKPFPKFGALDVLVWLVDTWVLGKLIFHWNGVESNRPRTKFMVSYVRSGCLVNYIMSSAISTIRHFPLLHAQLFQSSASFGILGVVFLLFLNWFYLFLVERFLYLRKDWPAKILKVRLQYFGTFRGHNPSKDPLVVTIVH